VFAADKERFVNERYPNSEISRKQVLATLMSLSSFEESWGMDFTMQDLPELQKAFSSIISTAYSGSKTTLIRFHRYAKWRIDNGLPCADSVFKLVPDRITAMKESMVSSPAHLAKVLDAVFDDPVTGSSDIIYRVFLWMGFSGISDSEALRVTKDEVDFRTMTIHHEGFEYPIYSESKYDFRIACDINEFVEGKKRRKRCDGDEIMRGKNDTSSRSPESVLIGTIRPMVFRRFKSAEAANQNLERPLDIGYDITFSRVLLSGTFYRMYQDEINGNPPDFAEYALAEFHRAQQSDKPYKVSDANPRWGILLRLRKSAESDYNSWKKAFNL